MKRFLHIILFILILSLAATGCVRITVTMPDEAQKQEVKDNLTAAKESVKEAVESIPGKMESAGEDIVKAIEDALPSSIESISTGSAVIDPSLIDEIDIDWVSGSVTISVWEGCSIRISETSDTELTEKEQRQKAREFVDRFGNPGKTTFINFYGLPVMTRAYAEELYEYSRKKFSGSL